MTDKLPLPIVYEYCSHKFNESMYSSYMNGDIEIAVCNYNHKKIENPFGYHCEDWNPAYSVPDIFKDPRSISDQEILVEDTSTKEELLKLDNTSGHYFTIDINMTIVLEEPINRQTLAETRIALNDIAGEYTGKLNSSELKNKLKSTITESLKATLNKGE